MKTTVSSKHSPSTFLALGVLLVGALGFGAVVSGALSTGCGMLAEGSIVESQEFTPAEMQRGGREYVVTSAFPLLEDLPRAGPERVDGLPIQWISNVGAGSLYIYYLDSPLGSTMTISEFLSAGGIAFLIEPRDGGPSFADSLPGLVGARATEVQVGGVKGVLTWADPTRTGVRSHNLYWADDQTNYSLIAVRGPEELVNLGRGIAC